MISYASVAEVRTAAGLRMCSIQGDFTCRRDGESRNCTLDWACLGASCLYEEERPRSLWSEILLLAERLLSSPPLIPVDQSARAQMFGLAHEICGEDGLGWSRHLLMFDSLQASANRRRGVREDKDTPIVLLKFLYSDNRNIAAAIDRIISIFEYMTALLIAQRSHGSR